MSEARFQPASDRTLMVYLGERITVAAHRQVLQLLRLLQAEPVAGICNLHPAYGSLLIKFDALKFGHDEVEAMLRPYLERLEEARLPEPRMVEIPVCYGEEYGPDLDEVAALHNLSRAQVIELHASATYEVYFFGFVPGFAYLGELPESLVTPRLAQPRRSVAPGSVGIAGSQTGVYPFATPGGWRLLGRTPVRMFLRSGNVADVAGENAMSVLSIGDRVRFTAISREKFAALEHA